jgi:hypothetical protein
LLSRPHQETISSHERSFIRLQFVHIAYRYPLGKVRFLVVRVVPAVRIRQTCFLTELVSLLDYLSLSASFGKMQGKKRKKVQPWYKSSFLAYKTAHPCLHSRQIKIL